MTYILVFIVIWLILVTIFSYITYKKYQIIYWKYKSLSRDFNKLLSKVNSWENGIKFDFDRPYTPTTKVFSKNSNKEIN